MSSMAWYNKRVAGQCCEHPRLGTERRLAMLIDSTLKRFWQKVDRSRSGDSCWNWIGGTSGDYGVFWVPPRSQLAHRVSFFIAHNRWPEPNACHTCDNFLCCNPDHLFECTNGENNSDRHEKGRSSHPCICKLDKQSALEVRRLYQLGSTMADLAEIFSVSRNTIVSVIRQNPTRCNCYHP